jgi:hypothetical protein
MKKGDNYVRKQINNIKGNTGKAKEEYVRETKGQTYVR